MSLFQQSSLTFSQAKSIVAEVIGKEDAGSIITNRAGRSIQAALRYWNRADWWTWARTLASDVAVDGTSTTQYALPYDLRGLYDVTVTATGSTPITYFFRNRREYDRLNLSQPSFIWNEYDLFRAGDLGVIDLIGLQGAGTLKMRYYRRLQIPCALTGISITTNITVGTANTITFAAGALAGAQIGAVIAATGIPDDTRLTAIGNTSATLSADATAAGTVTATIGADTDYLDIPADWEDGILAWAKHHFAVDQPVPAERLQYWKDYSLEVLERAKAENNYNEDEEISFTAPGDAYLNSESI